MMARTDSELESEVIAAFLFYRHATVTSAAQQVGISRQTAYAILHRTINVTAIIRERRAATWRRIAYLRECGWTNIRIADELGYSIQSVSQIVNRQLREAA